MTDTVSNTVIRGQDARRNAVGHVTVFSTSGVSGRVLAHLVTDGHILHHKTDLKWGFEGKYLSNSSSRRPEKLLSLIHVRTEPCAPPVASSQQ